MGDLDVAKAKLRIDEKRWAKDSAMICEYHGALKIVLCRRYRDAWGRGNCETCDECLNDNLDECKKVYFASLPRSRS